MTDSPTVVALAETAPAASALLAERKALEARCEHLSTQLSSRGVALSRHIALLAEKDEQIRQLEKQLAKQEKRITKLQKVVQSAKSWQERGWVKRAFHKWRAPHAG